MLRVASEHAASERRQLLRPHPSVISDAQAALARTLRSPPAVSASGLRLPAGRECGTGPTPPRRTPSPGMQVASRIWILWGIINLAPSQATHGSVLLGPKLGDFQPQLNLATLLTAWSVTEVIRYSFFAIKVRASDGAQRLPREIRTANEIHNCSQCMRTACWGRDKRQRKGGVPKPVGQRG
jgi:hypothetical protein